MTKRAILVLALGAVWAPVLVAETYSVKLVSGATLELLYPLQEAPWDKDTLVYLSEGGNWAGIHRSEVVAVQIETEFKGQGQLIDATTIFMGLAANDLPLPGDERETNSTERLLQVLQELGKPQVINTDQFVEPGAAGGGGIPLNLTQPYSPQTGAPPVLPLGSGFNTGAAGAATGGVDLVPVAASGGASQ